MTTSETAEALGISDAGVRKLVERERLTPVRAGARPLRFRNDDVWQLQRERTGENRAAEITSAWDHATAR